MLFVSTMDSDTALGGGAVQKPKKPTISSGLPCLRGTCRLRQEKWQWDVIAKEVYFENNGIDLPEDDVDREVKRLQAAHRRAYPEYYKK